MYRKIVTSSIAVAIVAIGTTGLALAGEGHEHGEGEHEEGVVALSADSLKESGVTFTEAGPATLVLKLKVNGRISPVSSKVAHISPRFPGIIRDVKKDVGEYAEAGELLAVVESNQTLQAYEMRASKPGLIAERHATVGESVQADGPLFILMDLSQVCADFTVFQRDVAQLQVGQVVNIRVSGSPDPIESTIHFISPVVDEATQSRIARAVVPNPGGTLAPGAFITGEIATGSFPVPVAVSEEAIQTIDGSAVVFVSEGERFVKRKIKTGRTDGLFTEVVSGLKAGERYASRNSFILKAELGKGEAEHED